MGKQYLNGVLYGTGEIIKFSPEIYSLEEREVGVWTDGKPLYEKTWILNYTAHTTAEHNTSIDIHDLNVEVPVAISGFWRRWAGDGKKLYYHWGSGEPTYGQGWARVDSENSYTNGRLAISIKSDGTDYQQVTLQYTKTTDTPGSGHYTTKGGEAHHYSLTEQVIGTWIDGKPLYEKTIVINNIKMGNHDGNRTTIAHGISNFGNIVSLQMACPKLGISAHDVLYSDSASVIAGFRVNTTNVYCVAGNAYFDSTADRYWYITIQYTKTTD